MLIIDAQIHLWTGDQAPPHHWRAPYRAEDALRDMDAAGVDRAINCPALWDPTANDYSVQAAQAHPDRFATLGWFDLNRPKDEAFLDAFLKRPGVLGLRFVLAFAPPEALAPDGPLEWIWAGAARRGCPVALMVLPAQYEAVARIAATYPDLRLLLDNIGFSPFAKLPEAAAHLEPFLDLARLDNIAVKATGAPSMATDPYPFASIHPVLRATFDAFGPHRMFWGTDITRLHCSWGECVTLFTEELDWLAGEDLELVMGRGVSHWLGWP
jgi:predicted TIM-barrel fold metal-dependent hydrolase